MKPNNVTANTSLSAPLKIEHDGLIDIATGRSRKELSWKNKPLLWSEFVKQISSTHRTAETYKEYIDSKKPRQDEIKDVGGFVGGYLTNGSRKAGNVLHRQLLTLDIDFGNIALWDDFLMLHGNAAALYSTHKHNPEIPRLRLLIPLDKPVFAAEYEAIARYIAGSLGIESFDPTTFEASRLMYWPSTSKDGEFIFRYHDSSWVKTDEILSSYPDWKDSSNWPTSDKKQIEILRSVSKQEDPLNKPGLIGAFCRTYNNHDAIEVFLSDIYEPSSIANRYTYKQGSTGGGMVVYDDKFAYSHHGTDPISGTLCNSFDLVRIHKFGLKDIGVKDNTPHNRIPSYAAMMDLVSKDPKVRILYGSELIQSAQDDFKDINSEEAVLKTDDDNTWMKDVEISKQGKYSSTINNLVLILSNDPNLKGGIAYDDLEKVGIATRNLPWRKITNQTRHLTDKDDDNIKHHLEKFYNVGFSKLNIALSVIYEKTKFHPVRNYLSPLEWDGQERLESLLIDYLGAEDNEYTRNVTRKTLVAAVARVFDPGVKFDHVLTLVGNQGIGKSTVISKLAKEWFSDSLGDIHKTSGMESLQGVWILEIAELAGFVKGEVEAIKHFITKRIDRYRVAYGHRSENFPRQCIFFATTNKPNFIRDSTGGRRFWPVAVSKNATKSVFDDLTESEIDQIWAEAVQFYKKGEDLFLTPELENIANGIQLEHAEVDERTGIIQEYLEILLPENWDGLEKQERRNFLSGDVLQAKGTIQRVKICAAEIWCEALDGRQKDMTSNNTKFIHEIMRSMEGWAEYKTKTEFKGYGRLKGYYRLNSNVDKGFLKAAANS